MTLYRGPDKTGEVIGSGVMHIHPIDFAKQMTTMKVLNARNERERIEGLARFGKFFAGIFWESLRRGVCRRYLLQPGCAAPA